MCRYEKSYSEAHVQVGSKFMIIKGRFLGQNFLPLIVLNIFSVYFFNFSINFNILNY